MRPTLIHSSRSQQLAYIAAAAVTTAIATFCGCKIYNIFRNENDKITPKTIRKTTIKLSLVVAALVFASIESAKINSLKHRVLFMTNEFESPEKFHFVNVGPSFNYIEKRLETIEEAWFKVHGYNLRPRPIEIILS